MPNSKVPAIFLPAFKQAISYFPELADKQIFIYETFFFGVQHASRAYPPILSLNNEKLKRVYPITINKHQSTKTFFSSLSLEEQVGLLAHELSHACAYSKLSSGNLIVFSIRYAFSKKFVKRIEKETDLRVVARGAGKCLLKERIASFRFRQTRPYPEVEDTYITPMELLENLKKYPHKYTEKILVECAQQLESITGEIKKTSLPNRISIKRKIKHSLKTIWAFFPEFFKLFYIIVIKKSYLNRS